jgi:hypothetical protein
MLAIVFGGDGCFLWREVNRFGEGIFGGAMGGPFPTQDEAIADATNEGFILIPAPRPNARRDRAEED